MSQFSVYLKFCGTKEQTAPVVKRIVDNSPKDGQISILFFTDKQFSDIINIQNREIIENKNIPEQLLLFMMKLLCCKTDMKISANYCWERVCGDCIIANRKRWSSCNP